MVPAPSCRRTGSIPLRWQPASAGPSLLFAQSRPLSCCKAVPSRRRQQPRQAPHRPGPRSHRRQPKALGEQRILARSATARPSNSRAPAKSNPRGKKEAAKAQKKRLNQRPASPRFFGLRQGSSGVEQGTHKPLVGSSTLPPGTFFSLGSRKNDHFRPNQGKESCLVP